MRPLLWGEDLSRPFLLAGTCLRAAIRPLRRFQETASVRPVAQYVVIRGYRFSEDLDFTLRQGATPVTAADAASAWCQFVGEEGGIRAEATADEVKRQLGCQIRLRGPT